MVARSLDRALEARSPDVSTACSTAVRPSVSDSPTKMIDGMARGRHLRGRASAASVYAACRSHPGDAGGGSAWRRRRPCLGVGARRARAPPCAPRRSTAPSATGARPSSLVDGTTHTSPTRRRRESKTESRRSADASTAIASRVQGRCAPCQLARTCVRRTAAIASFDELRSLASASAYLGTSWPGLASWRSLALGSRALTKLRFVRVRADRRRSRRHATSDLEVELRHARSTVGACRSDAVVWQAERSPSWIRSVNRADGVTSSTAHVGRIILEARDGALR